MTDTNPAAVELLATELPDTHWQAPRLHRAADTLRALSAQLEAASQLAKQAQQDAENWARLAACSYDAAETARAEGRADGLREAAKRLHDLGYDDVLGTIILALITADTPAAKYAGPGESPHVYSPDIMAQGDCRICGHTAQAHEKADTPASADDDIPDTPEQRALIAAHNEEMRRKYPNMVEIAEPAKVTVQDSFSGLVSAARAEAEKAMRKFPQPNYVLLKVAEEAGEVVKACVHFAEGRETRENVEGEMRQTIAMLYRLWVEGDEVNGVRAIAGGRDE
jgi:hypothetical protein